MFENILKTLYGRVHFIVCIGDSPAFELKLKEKEIIIEILNPILAIEFGVEEFIKNKGKTDSKLLGIVKKLGYKIVIFPVTTLRIANKAVEEVLKLIMETGTQKPMLDRMQTRKELYKILKYYDYEAIDRKVSELML